MEGDRRLKKVRLLTVEECLEIRTSATPLIMFTWKTVEPVIPETKASFEALYSLFMVVVSPRQTLTVRSFSSKGGCCPSKPSQANASLNITWLYRYFSSKTIMIEYKHEFGWRQWSNRKVVAIQILIATSLRWGILTFNIQHIHQCIIFQASSLIDLLDWSPNRRKIVVHSALGILNSILARGQAGSLVSSASHWWIRKMLMINVRRPPISVSQNVPRTRRRHSPVLRRMTH
jgi:hypothetical protein